MISYNLYNIAILAVTIVKLFYNLSILSKGYKVWQNGHSINNIHSIFPKFDFARATKKTYTDSEL